MVKVTLLWIFFIFSLPLEAGKKKEKISGPSQPYQTIYRSLDTNSILEHLAFYELYGETPEGKEALQRACHLLTGSELEEGAGAVLLPDLDVSALIGLLTKGSFGASAATCAPSPLLEKGSASLENRKLDGHHVWSKKEVLSLPSEEIDLARALLLYQFEEEEGGREKILSYEMALDFMALEIRAHLSASPSAQEMINQMNHFIFHRMGFRFPPHSLHVKDIDLYTFLPSVMDSRLGVCLGVSTLYLCLAQRLGLELNIITPPGHILLSYGLGPDAINIETTARGIHLPTDTYLGLTTKEIEKRTMKEVVGMAFFNRAPVVHRSGNVKGAIELYKQALQYMPEDDKVKMLLGIHYLFDGQKKKGTALLKEVKGKIFAGEIVEESIPCDFLQGKVDAEGIEMVFMPVDETRESIIAKQKKLHSYLKKHPHFRSGLMQLAVSYLQLGRWQEAFDVLMQYHDIDPSHPVIEYYLSIVSMQRRDMPRAWQFYTRAEKLTQKSQHSPRALRELKGALARAYPSRI